MPRVSPAVLTFAAGEWSPRISSRIDFSKYQQSVVYSRNALPTIEGPVDKRNGSKYISNTIENEPSQLIPWSRSRAESY